MPVKRLVILGVVAYCFFLLLKFPASAAVAWLTPDNVVVSQPSGTIWSGTAAAVTAEQLSLGATRWRFTPSTLFRGRVGVSVTTQLDGGELQTRLARGLGSRLYLSDLTGVIPLRQLSGLMDPNLYSATVGLDMAELVLDGGWPVDAQGTVDVVKLSALQPSRREVGSYALRFDGSGEEPLVADITDVDGLLQVEGTISFASGRQYTLDCAITPRPGAPRELVQVLDMLGERQSDGARRMVLEGTAP